MIGKSKVKASTTPNSEKVSVSNRTPKHCNKSSLHGETPKHCNKSTVQEKRCQTSPSKKTQKSPQKTTNPMEGWGYYNTRPHPVHQLGNDPTNGLSTEYPTEYPMPVHYQKLHGLGSHHDRNWMMYDSSEKASHLTANELGNNYHNRRNSTGTSAATQLPYSMPPSFQKDGSFSRAVSTSFGETQLTGGTARMVRHGEVDHYADHRSRISDGDSDASWKALHQVASVDEENFHRHYARNQAASPTLPNDDNSGGDSPFDCIHHSSSTLSNSSASSLFIHSFPTPSKLIRLNSLSSIASTQKPLETCVTYDSKTQAALCDNEDASMGTKTRKRTSPEESDSARKKSRCSSPSSFTNFHGPPCFTLSLDSMNSFSNEEQNQSYYLAPNIQSSSKPFLSDTKTSWDLTDRIVGTFTFDTCESVGDSSQAISNREPDQFINQTISARLDMSSGRSKTSTTHGQMISYMDPYQEKRNPSFDSYTEPRISNDGKRDDSVSSRSDNREDIGQGQALVSHAWNHPFPPNYGPTFYPQPITRGQNITNTMDSSMHQGSHPMDNRYPPYASHVPVANVDYRNFWPQYGCMHPHYGHNDYWRLSSNPLYGKNGSEVKAGPTIIHQPKVLGLNKWSSEEDAILTSIMKMNKYDEGDFESVAAEIGRGKSAKECEARWFRYLKPGARKGQWQDFEDALVVEAVLSSREQPFTKWSELALRLPGRVGKQIRDRWINHLNPNINHNPFSAEEDLLLWEGHKKFGNKWVEISVKCFRSSRSENHIKNRFYSASFKKFVTSEFGEDAYKDRSQLDEKVCSDDGNITPSNADEHNVEV